MKLRLLKLFFIFALFVFFLGSTILLTFAYFFTRLASDVHLPPKELASMIYRAFSQDQFTDPTNILILGLDERDDALEHAKTTDTIMLAAIIPKTSPVIKIISIPRDLWVYSLGTKINQIYPDSLERPHPNQYVISNFQKITGQKIDKLVILTTQDLIEFINIIGGVDVNLPYAFKDDMYPNPDYINHPSPDTPIYKTIEFSQGINRIDQTNVTEFVRSRKGSDDPATGGTDLGRIARQQLLIQAIIDKFKDPHSFTYQQVIGLINFFQQGLQTTLTLEDLFVIASRLMPHLESLSIEKYSLPVKEYATEGVIYHPPTFINRQWVFLPIDKNYAQVHQFIQETLFP